MTDALAIAILVVFAGTLWRNSRKTGAVSSAPPKGPASFFAVWRRPSAPFAFFNNSRIADMNGRISDMGKRIDDLSDSVNRHIDDKFALLSQQMKHMEDNIMRIVVSVQGTDSAPPDSEEPIKPLGGAFSP
jgi:hypothetical protein